MALKSEPSLVIRILRCTCQNHQLHNSVVYLQYELAFLFRGRHVHATGIHTSGGQGYSHGMTRSVPSSLKLISPTETGNEPFIVSGRQYFTMMKFSEFVRLREGLSLNVKNAIVGLIRLNPPPATLKNKPRNTIQPKPIRQRSSVLTG